MSSKKPVRKSSIREIKTGLFARGAALAKVTLQVGAKAASAAVSQAFSGNLEASEIQERAMDLFKSQISILTREVGELKGSLMKVGQMISVVGENVLPREINDILKTLQSDSPPLEWESIEKQLKRQLGDEKLATLEIEPVAVASASMGQVHRAVRKSDGQRIALKVQYPGVDQAIDSDLKALKRIFSFTRIVPVSGFQFDEVFNEVRQMLHQEVNYEKEAEFTRSYGERFRDDKRYWIPKVIPEYCTKRIMATEFVDGVRVDSPEVQALSQERRNALGMTFLEHYFREIFVDRIVQTDPHLGNYLIHIGDVDRLVLLDFGAIRQFPQTFCKPYFEMVRGAFLEDRERVIRGGRGIGYISDDDSTEGQDLFFKLCCMIMDPFKDEEFDWGRASAELPKQTIKVGKEMAFKMKLKPPPREVVFLDRKMAGVYSFMTVLGAKVNSRALLKRYLFPEG